MERTLSQRLCYRLFRVLARLASVVGFALRTSGREHYPAAGAALVCANHQSFLDPVLVGLTCNRRMNCLARDTLFDVPLLGALIRFLDAIPIDRDGMGLTGLKETLRRLKRGELVLIFPEGTRTNDGEVQPLMRGFCAVARRSQALLIPVGIDGAFHAWPRQARFPRPAAIEVVVGEPISPAQFADLSDDELVAELERRIRACHAEARAGRERSGRA